MERLVVPRPWLTKAVGRDAVTASPDEDRLHIADPELRKVTGQTYNKGPDVYNDSDFLLVRQIIKPMVCSKPVVEKIDISV